MNALLIYLLKVIAIQAVLYLIYCIVFHESGRHAVNRFYVIATFVTSFAIPAITLPDYQARDMTLETERPVWQEIAERTQISVEEAELIPVENLNKSSYGLRFIVLGILLVSVFLLGKLIFSHFQLLSLKKQSDRILKNGIPIYCSRIDSPFSYFNHIFIPQNLVESPSFETIINHELVHVKKWHSVDRIVLELILAVFWFNPFHYLFRNRLIETHEFQADEEVIALENDPLHYQEVLYQQINSRSALATANHFKLNTIKTRIKMINKDKKLSRWTYLFILPALAVITFSFSNKEKAIFIAPLQADVTEEFENFIGSVDRYIPSIFPLKDSEGVKLTAGFGKSVHPILKVERMHEGIDLKTYKGNPVLATADGIVVEAGVINEVSWGKIIRLKHGDLYETVYAHLSDVEVEVGELVKRGDIVGKSGSTGNSTGPHLHYEVKETYMGFLDPTDFINNYNFELENSSQKLDAGKLRSKNEKLRVVLDPGHGGSDKGISSNRLTEKEIALKVAQAVAEIFENSDQVEIVLTREKDEIVSLKDRVSKSDKADLFISLHVEKHEDENEEMMMAIYNDQNDHAAASQYFGEKLSGEFDKINRKFKVGYTDGYYILQNANSPAILFNMGYFSNTESVDYLNSDEGIKQIAIELSDAILASL